ncbi:glyoxylate reductase/hydroxypyruvate reductase isoform X1 [Parasteatoda tepidariorum]|uniref:glyoxylate reductase/hydroxypyruvate reductase isoform X1 n=2 Tax=Parasteatoda tepidariorum TaxID=114398 RepID=UPI001C723DBA|nr:glyoxylate reductase/hydroxypyruvate reductase isoform X1 [Parasteatoda tepidariorum]
MWIKEGIKQVNFFFINKIKRALIENTLPLCNMASSKNSTSRQKVLVTRSDIPEPGIKLLKEKYDMDIYPVASPMPREELLSRIKGKNAILCMLTDKIDKEFLDAAGPDLKVVGTLSVGFDHIDLSECHKRGVHVGNTPNVLTDAAAELTVALVLATARRLMEATKQVVNGGWAKCSWAPLWMCGTSLTGSTVGIYGLGRIGFGVAERLKGFKVKDIIYAGRKEKPEAREKLNAKFVPFNQLLEQSDFIIVCTALTPETHGIFNLEAFKNMKRSAIFINTSRGKVVNQEDLYTALTTGLIRAAGLDVTDPEPLPTDHKLTKLSNCVLLPHIATAVVETRENMSIITANNILAGLEGKPLPCPL